MQEQTEQPKSELPHSMAPVGSDLPPAAAKSDAHSRREWAQTQLDTHPDASPFWDSDEGQEASEIANTLRLRATNTNRERCAIYREMREEL